MALFKIFKGPGLLGDLNEKRPSTVEGYCYFTPQDGKFYIDVVNDDNLENNPAYDPRKRVVLNAGHADTAAFYSEGQVGGTSIPIFINSIGQPQACEEILSTNISGGLVNGSGELLNIGNSKLPIYFADGRPVVCNNTLNVNIEGNASTADHADEATHAINADEAQKSHGTYYLLSQEDDSSLSVGNINIPSYFVNGVPTICQENSAVKLGQIQNNNGVYSVMPYSIGSVEKPVYFQDGIPKECDKLKLNSAGNEMLPIYINNEGQAETCNQFLPLSAGKDYTLTGALGLGFNKNYGIRLPEEAFDG